MRNEWSAVSARSQISDHRHRWTVAMLTLFPSSMQAKLWLRNVYSDHGLGLQFQMNRSKPRLRVLDGTEWWASSARACRWCVIFSADYLRVLLDDDTMGSLFLLSQFCMKQGLPLPDLHLDRIKGREVAIFWNLMASLRWKRETNRQRHFCDGSSSHSHVLQKIIGSLPISIVCLMKSRWMAAK